jgi:hypothetical protein
MESSKCKNGCGADADARFDGFCSYLCKGGFQMKAYRELDKKKE